VVDKKNKVFSQLGWPLIRGHFVYPVPFENDGDMVMKWKKSFEIGISQIDLEHKALVSLIQKLENSMYGGSVSKTTGAVLKELVEYVKLHFKNEEKMMSNVGYPELSRHKILHKDLVNDVAAILIDLKNGKQWTASELVGFLNYWLREHILQEDKKIGQYLGLV